MSAPAEPRPETGSTNAPSAQSDVDETVAAEGKPAPGLAAGLFGPRAAPNEVGTLGPYRVVKELGKGGMGAVYAAIDTRLDRRLALKVMLPQFAADAAAKERFLREAKAAAKISHDNVVTVFEADERQGVPYIAMQFLEGLPLDAFLKKKGSPTIPQILRIGAEAAAGLAAAHKIGLVHRDIKPANLWLEAPNGRAKVLDFGLAKPVDAEVEVTRSGAVVGTPAYMSPEQARGEKVDHRTDLFSLGAVLYRLCTGKLPFQGATTMAVLMALGTEEPPPVRELNPNVPESLAALIHQLLSKRADARPQSAAEAVKRLRAIAEELAAPRIPSAELSTSQPQVVYVPIQVTVAPEANPFADLDSPATEPESQEPAESAAPPDPKPVRKQSGAQWLWPVVGFAVLAAVVAASVLVLKNKSDTATKTQEPDDATVKRKDGKTIPSVGPGPKVPVANTDADRTAAEWVLSVGGTVGVNGGALKEVKAVADLPVGPLRLTFVNLGQNKQVTDDELTRFAGCKSITSLNLSFTDVTDAGLANFKDCNGLYFLNLNGARRVTGAGLAHFSGCEQLKHLPLEGTQVSDAGLVHLKNLKELGALQLGGTRVTDAGLEHLRELKRLGLLDVRKTNVTAKGLEGFHAALPGCKIEHDGGTIQPADVDRTTAEWVFAQGGFVRVNDEAAERKTATALPKERFALTGINLNGKQVTDTELSRFKEFKGLTKISLNRTRVSDAGLVNFKECKGLTELFLERTAVSDAGVAQFAEFKSLTGIDLRGTTVTDAGLVHLKDLKGLKLINLSDTKVTDVGLVHLKELTKLTNLNLKGTKVSAKELEALAAALPACKIEHDGGTIEPKK